MTVTVMCFFVPDHIADVKLSTAGINMKTAVVSYSMILFLFFLLPDTFSQNPPKKTIKAGRDAKAISKPAPLLPN